MPAARIYRLKITLLHVDPPVWRTVEVPGDMTLQWLHFVIQLAVGWEDAHLHMFTTRLGEFGDPGIDLDVGDERQVTLAEVAPRARSRLGYSYDLGDDWVHDIRVEQTFPAEPGIAYPRVAAGERACPPEDCGGP